MDRLATLMMEPKPIMLTVMVSEKLKEEIEGLAERMGWPQSRAARYLMWQGVKEVKAERAL